MTLNELQRIKKWHVAHRADHPVEYHLWDAILTLWVMGWVGFLPAYAFGQFWTCLCAPSPLRRRACMWPGASRRIASTSCAATGCVPDHRV